MQLSSNAYVANNPINAIDLDGWEIIFVNGYINTGDGTMPRIIADNLIGTTTGRGY